MVTRHYRVVAEGLALMVLGITCGILGIAWNDVSLAVLFNFSFWGGTTVVVFYDHI
jgi:hypothetical protein